MGVGGDSCFDGHELKRNRHGQGTCSLAELLMLTFPIGYHALVIDGSLALLAPDGMPTIIGCTHQTSIGLKNNTSFIFAASVYGLYGLHGWIAWTELPEW